MISINFAYQNWGVRDPIPGQFKEHSTLVEQLLPIRTQLAFEQATIKPTFSVGRFKAIPYPLDDKASLPVT